MPIRIPSELPEDQKKLLLSGELCALQLRLEASLERWYGNETQGLVLEALPLDKASERFGPRTVGPYDSEEI